MKFVLIPVKEGTSFSEDSISLPAMIMNLISAIVLSIWGTSVIFPDLHGWGRFGVCVLTVIVMLVLTVIPIIGTILCIANGIAWIVVLWMLFGNISIVWLKWTLRIVSIILIVAFESVPVISSIENWRR